MSETSLASERAQRAIPAEEALRTARLDAERVYSDLADYRASVRLEPDGWHVDYDLKNPEANGGGAHYVIDRTRGTIVEKTYEQ